MLILILTGANHTPSFKEPYSMCNLCVLYKKEKHCKNLHIFLCSGTVYQISRLPIFICARLFIFGTIMQWCDVSRLETRSRLEPDFEGHGFELVGLGLRRVRSHYWFWSWSLMSWSWAFWVLKISRHYILTLLLSLWYYTYRWDQYEG